MGELSDDYIENEIFKHLNPKLDDLFDELTWLTKTYEEIPISNMTTTHIENVINCLHGKGNSKIPENWWGKSHKQWLNIFYKELNYRKKITND